MRWLRDYRWSWGLRPQAPGIYPFVAGMMRFRGGPIPDRPGHSGC